MNAPFDRASPFTISEPTIKFNGIETEPTTARSMTVGNLIHNLIVFADLYEWASAEIERAEPHLKPRALGEREANAHSMQREFRATVGIDRVRAYILAEYGTDLTIGSARRLLGNLIQVCGLTVAEAEALPLETAMDRLETTTAPPPPKQDRLTVDEARLTLTLDGTTYDVRSAKALRWVRVLIARKGDWISGSADLEDAEQELVGNLADCLLLNARTDRLRGYLPEPVLALIDSQPGAGSRIRL